MKRFIIKHKTDGSIIGTLSTKKQASDFVIKLVELNKLDNVFDVVYEEQGVDDYPHTFGKEIDWEQRRYEMAKDVLIALISKPEIVLTASDAKVAIRYADALIEELKKENNG